MFEGTLIESRGLAVTGTKRWTTLGSVAFQFGVVGLLVAIPLMHPEMLPFRVDAPHLVAPIPVKPPVRVRVEETTSTSTGVSVPTASPAPASTMPSLLHNSAIADAGLEPIVTTGISMGTGTGGGLFTGLGTGAAANVTAKVSAPVKLSSGVTAGLLLSPIQPVYPAIAKAAGVQGTVVMEAVISKTGRIESLHALSGPPMLRNAALEAVQAARYEPYRLSGEATEVQTTITVVFRLGAG